MPPDRASLSAYDFIIKQNPGKTNTVAPVEWMYMKYPIEIGFMIRFLDILSTE